MQVICGYIHEATKVMLSNATNRKALSIVMASLESKCVA